MARGPSFTIGFRVRREAAPRKIIRQLNQSILPPIMRELQSRAVTIARKYSEEDLINDRPPDRRRRDDVPHYIDSFVEGFFELSGGRARIVMRNTHPFAKGIELGWPEHDISSSGKAGGNGQVASFPVGTMKGGDYTSSAAPYMAYGEGVPGRATVHSKANSGYHIMERAADEVQKESSVMLALLIGGVR